MLIEFIKTNPWLTAYVIIGSLTWAVMTKKQFSKSTIERKRT